MTENDTLRTLLSTYTEIWATGKDFIANEDLGYVRWNHLSPTVVIKFKSHTLPQITELSNYGMTLIYHSLSCVCEHCLALDMHFG